MAASGIGGQAPGWLDPSPGRAAVKICGVTNARDAGSVVAAGADALGVNLWPGSKRFVKLEDATPWLAPLAGRIARVAVLVNPTIEEVEQLAGDAAIDAVQLHGDESPEFCARAAGTGLVVVKALRVRAPADTRELGRFGVHAVLLDAYRPGEYGGTGDVFDWTLAAEAVLSNPVLPVLLAGGLTPENVATAVAQVRPAAVDVAGGVESAPGVKDDLKVREFVANAKRVGY